MEKSWLPNLLMDGSITDNSLFHVPPKSPFVLYKNGKVNANLHRHKGGTMWVKNEPRIWNFLEKSHNELSYLFENKNLLKQHLVLLNEEEYEHNTPDILFKLDGKGFDNWKIQTGNLVGIIKKHGYTLNVSSRFGNHFLKALISDTDGFLEIENFGGSGDDSGMEWLLIYLWKIKLKKAYRLGIPKTYISQREQLNTVRGNLNILDYAIKGKHIAQYQCQYREHSYDNDVNRLINTTFRKLKGNDLIQDTMPLNRAFETAVKGKRIPLKQLANIQKISNPYYQEYNEVINLSKKILRDELADFGEQSDFNALFFDVSMLFEYFIRKLIIREDYSLNPKNEKTLFIPSGGTYRKGTRALIPDIIFDDEHQNTHIFDVKYKRYDFTYGVKREDLFQIHTYLGQISNSRNVVRCGFIYPIPEDQYPEDGFKKENLTFNGNTVDFEIHFFKVPKAKEGKEFIKSFNKNKADFIQKLLNK